MESKTDSGADKAIVLDESDEKYTPAGGFGFGLLQGHLGSMVWTLTLMYAGLVDTVFDFGNI